MEEKNKKTTAGGGQSPASTEPDRIIWCSEDKLVKVRQKVRTAKRYPRHGYPVVVLELRPAPFTRVQRLEDGSGGLEVLLTHEEVERHLTALNAADPKVKYTVTQSVPPKSAERRAYWQRVHQQRLRRRRR